MPRSLFCNVVASLLMASAIAFGQSQNASLDGQVTDKSGAVVPQAAVTISAAERQLSTTVQTDNEGRYAFPNLAPGTYDLSVSAKGFRTYVQNGIQLLANQAARRLRASVRQRKTVAEQLRLPEPHRRWLDAFFQHQAGVRYAALF